LVITHYRAPGELSGELHALRSTPFFTPKNLETLPYGFESDADIFEWLCAMASESPTARIMLKDAQSEGWNIRLSDVAQEGYAFDDDAQIIMLDHAGFTAGALGRSTHLRNTLFMHFIKALRQLWHDRAGLDFEGSQRPDALLMLERARSADAQTTVILVGWELRAAGHADLWRSILGSEEGDMAMVFTRAIERDPAGFYDGSVLTRTFCQWYGDAGRVAECDHAMLEEMDAWLGEAKGAQVFGSEPLRSTDVEKISKLPGGTAYLSGMGRNICTDPYFMSLNDPINESHLFQIVYDSKVVMAGGVPFRDQRLARLIFPLAAVETSK